MHGSITASIWSKTVKYGSSICHTLPKAWPMIYDRNYAVNSPSFRPKLPFSFRRRAPFTVSVSAWIGSDQKTRGNDLILEVGTWCSGSVAGSTISKENRPEPSTARWQIWASCFCFHGQTIYQGFPVRSCRKFTATGRWNHWSGNIWKKHDFSDRYRERKSFGLLYIEPSLIHRVQNWFRKTDEWEICRRTHFSSVN
jgi:hypothetical protein